MPIARFDMKHFVASLEPGIAALVVSAFEERLQKKLDSIIDEVYSELEKELPKEISVKIRHAFFPDAPLQELRIEVDLKDSTRKKE